MRPVLDNAKRRSSRLSRHAVVDAALAIVDTEGLQGLTIRALAYDLGVPPMTLYAHFKTKHELLDLAFERLLQHLIPPESGSTWQAEVEEICKHMRRVLLEHPHWIPLLTRVTVPTSAMEIYHRLLSFMWKDGFYPEAAMFAFSSAMSLAIGSVLVERMMGHPPVPFQRLALMEGNAGRDAAWSLSAPRRGGAEVRPLELRARIRAWARFARHRPCQTSAPGNVAARDGRALCLGPGA